MVKKLAIGFLVVGLVALAGYFGVRTWSERTALTEVEQAFERIRARGATARFASAEIDTDKKGIVLTGVEIGSKDGAVMLKVDRLTATGAVPPSDGYVEAEALDLDGASLSVSGAAASGGRIVYLLPKVMIDQYRGPVALVASASADSDPAEEMLRVALQQLAATSAAKITIPEMAARKDPAAAGEAPITVQYENIAAEQLSAGKISSLIIDRVAFSGPFLPATAPAPSNGAATGAPADARTGLTEGQVTGIVAARIDTTPVLDILAPPQLPPGADNYREVYGKVVTGPYTVKEPNGQVSSGRSMLLEHVGIKPSAFTRARLEALTALSHKGPDLSLEEASDYLERMIDVLDAVAFRTLAVTDARTTSPQESAHFGMLRLDGFAAGVLDAFELEGVEGQDARGRQMKMGRFSVRRFDLPALVKLARQPGGPSVFGLLQLFKVISGVEAAGIEVPYEKDGAAQAPLKLGHFSLSWGSFLGELPSKLNFEVSDLTGPISAGDGEPFTYLANAGMTSATSSAALNLAYDPDAQVLSLAPASIEVEKAFSLKIDAGVGNLPKEAFADVGGVLSALARINGRPLTITIRDLGLAKLMLAQLAEADGVTPDELRQELIAAIDEQAAQWADVTKDASGVADALKAFVNDPSTLTVTATPRTNAPLMPLLAGDDPLQVLQAFDITATTKP